MLFDLIEESKRLIGLRSDEGNRGVVEWLIPFCKKLGFQIMVQGTGNGLASSTSRSERRVAGGDDAATDVNLIAHSVAAESADLCSDGLALVTHLDTVPPGDASLWTKTGGDPFKAVVEGDKIYGLGSADTKLDFLCKLLAIEKIVKAYGNTPLQEIFKIPIALIGTFGEERALAGARLIRETGIMHPRFALIGEPSELKAVIAHKGILYLKASFREAAATGVEPQSKMFKGKAAHGAMPHLGENAVEKAIRWVTAQKGLDLAEIAGGTVHNIVPDACRVAVRKSKSPSKRIDFLKKFIGLMESARKYLKTHSNREFDPPHTTDNIGVIRMRGRETIEIEFDFRLIPETDGNELFEIFQGLEKEIPGASIEVIRSNPPMDTPRESELAGRVGKAQEAVGLPRSFRVKSGNTEGAIFNDMGVESVVIGPGQSAGNIHAPNEYNEISQLKKAVEFYTAFLKQFC